MRENWEKAKYYSMKTLKIGALMTLGGAIHSEAERGLFGSDVQRVARAGIQESVKTAATMLLDNIFIAGGKVHEGIDYVKEQTGKGNNATK